MVFTQEIGQFRSLFGEASDRRGKAFNNWKQSIRLELWRVHDRMLELDGGQDLGRFSVERFADGEEAFE